VVAGEVGRLSWLLKERRRRNGCISPLVRGASSNAPPPTELYGISWRGLHNVSVRGQVSAAVYVKSSLRLRAYVHDALNSASALIAGGHH
jgi:hypothetical protein